MWHVVLAVLVSAEHPPARPLVVVATGPDTQAVGRVQFALERQLAAADGFELRGAAALIERFRPPPLPQLEIDTAAQKQRTVLMEELRNAYYEGRYDEAMGLCDAAAALLQREAGAQRRDKVSVALWRATVLLAQQHYGKAVDVIERALQLDPDLRVDVESEFPPSLRDVVERTRLQLGRLLTVSVLAVPVGTTLRLDGETVSNPFRSYAGRHQLEASAAGYRPVVVELELRSEVELPLPVALDAALEHALQGAIVSDGGGLGPRVGAGLLERLGTDCAAAAVQASAWRVTVWCDEGGAVVSPMFEASAAGEAALVNWVFEALPRPGQAGTLHVAVGPSFFALDSRFGDPKAVAENGGSFAGLGFGADLALLLGALQLRMGTTWHALVFQEVEFELSDKSKGYVHGGYRANGRLVASYGGPREGSVSIDVGVGLRYQNHQADPLKDDGEKVALFVSYDRFSVEAELRLRALLARAEPLGDLTLHAALFGAPWALVRERPATASGEDVKWSWHGGAEAQLRWGTTWFVGLGGSTFLQQTTYSGASTIPLETAVSDGARREIGVGGEIVVGRPVDL